MIWESGLSRIRKPALLAGIHEWQVGPPNPAWKRYAQENSWSKNAGMVIERMFKA
ncbi:MAG: hypothetical protein WDN00_08565 [Limisphaerales bacterium]